MAKKHGKKKGRTPPMAERHRRGTGLVYHPAQGVRTIGADDGEPMPALDEGLLATPMHYEGESVTLHIPTAALLKISEIAAREELELALERAPRAPGGERLDPAAQHQLASLTRVTSEGGADFVRAFARLFLRGETVADGVGSKVSTAWQGWIDLPTRYVGMMLEASQPRDKYATRDLAGAREDGTPIVRTPLTSARPRWAGSYTFDKVYDRQVELTGIGGAGNLGALMRSDGRIVAEDPQFVLGVEAIGLLDRAHLLRVEADQVELLPDWEDPADAADFAADAHLPFDPLYFEFEGAGGVAPAHEVELHLTGDAGEIVQTARGAMVVRGALVWRGESESLTIEPFGDVYVLREGESFRGARERPSLTNARSPVGRVVFGHVPLFEPAEGITGRQRIVCVGPDQREVAESYPIAIDAGLYAGGAIPGVIVLPFTPEQAGEIGWSDGEVASWGAVALSMAFRVLACLSIMETEAVVVDDAAMEVRDKKRADKRGWKISQQVYVRPTRRGPRHEPTGNEREYSHQFWVSGHYKHFPIGTRMADSRPDLVKPCTRLGEASCGMCRRLWTPPFIKGPDDKPLVVKSLVKRGHREAAAK